MAEPRDKARERAMRTKMRTVRGLGAAHAGTGHFWLQRMTAVANIPLMLFFVGLLAALSGRGFAETRAALENPWVALPLLLALLSILVHMRLGMQVIIEDYVHGELSKLALLMLNSFFAVAVGVACVFAILKLAFAGAAS
jgi:succinate dehydrogenase / fumarate reductase, membrane anchor subunit